MKKTTLILIALVAGLQVAKAEISLPQIIGDGMVLQQNTDARIWGKATPGAIIEISSDWSSTVWSAQTGEDGRWILSIATPEGSMTPRTITITEKMPKGRKAAETVSSVTLDNILVGEVWLCSGQSNMEMPLDALLEQGPWILVSEHFVLNHVRLDLLHLISLKEVRNLSTNHQV